MSNVSSPCVVVSMTKFDRPVVGAAVSATYAGEAGNSTEGVRGAGSGKSPIACSKEGGGDLGLSVAVSEDAS